MNVGDTFPHFRLKNQDDEWFDSKTALESGPLVMFFYPKDQTPLCTKQACSFRDEYDVLKEFDATVIGISADGVESHKKFQQAHGFPFDLLSDTDRAVRKQLKVPRSLFGLHDGRATYVIDQSGTVKLAYVAAIKAKEHVDQALKVLVEMRESNQTKAQ